MFDLGFFELVLISVVALLVLGPERLPGALRTLSLWVGRLRRNFNKVKREIEQEIGADEIRRQLRNEAIMDKFQHTRNQVKEGIDAVKKEADSVTDNLDLKKQFSDPGGEGGKPGGRQSPEKSEVEAKAVTSTASSGRKEASAGSGAVPEPSAATGKTSTTPKDAAKAKPAAKTQARPMKASIDQRSSAGAAKSGGGEKPAVNKSRASAKAKTAAKAPAANGKLSNPTQEN